MDLNKINFNKIRKFCKIFRISLGSFLILIAVFLENNWFLLGLIPLIAGILDFCPICIISGRCDIKNKNKKNDK